MIVLFDLGGVLSKPLKMEELFSFIKPEISFNNFCDYWLNDKIVLDAHQGLVTDKYHIKCLLDYCKSKVTIEQFYKEYCNMSNGFYKDTISIIKYLQSKKIKVGLLSNLREMDYIREKTLIDSFNFDYLFLSYKMKMLKPNLDIYQAVIKVCDCDPKEIYYFDDNIFNVEAAKKCGINSYQVTGENILKFIENKKIF